MFHDPLILYFALVAIPISTLAGIAVRKLFYVGPPTFEEPDYYALGTSAPFAGSMVDNNAVGRTGELVTAIMMVQRGWRQLPSEKDVKGNTRGLDGLFVRQLNKRVGGYEICIAETKASSTRATPSSAKYRPEDMADAMVKRKLEDLRDTRHDDGRAYLDEKVANQIISAIGTKYLSKRLFIHSFELSESSIYELSTTGDIGESPIEIISHGQHAAMLEALEIGLARIVKFVGKDHPTTDIIDYRKVAMKKESGAILDVPKPHHRLGVHISRRAIARDEPVVPDYQI